MAFHRSPQCGICHTGSVSSFEHYSQRLRAREAALAQSERVHARIGSVRLALGALFLFTAWLCFGRFALPPAWLLLPIAVFAALQGTNSADRRIGAQGVIRALIERGAIGLISTHDLALTHIDGLAAGALENVHFQDELIDGKLKFDFKLHPGVVTKSNGIELMRSIGLDV